MTRKNQGIGDDLFNTNVPSWVTRTAEGILVCGLCMSIVYQTGQGWFCLNIECEKHEHIPERPIISTGGWGDSVVASGTATSTASGVQGPITFITWPESKGGES